MTKARISAHSGRDPHAPTQAEATAISKHVTDDVECGAKAGASSTRFATAVRLATFTLLIAVGGAMATTVGPGNTGSHTVNAQTRAGEPAGAVPLHNAADMPTESKTNMNEYGTAGLEFDPFADILPLMGEKEFEALVEDIRAHGLQEPITVHQGKIVDGRNRYLACRKLGKVPDVVPWDGRGSLAAFVASRNIHRRHLTPSQLAMFGGRLVDEFAKEAKVNMSRGGQRLADLPTVHSRDRAAQAVNVSSRLVGSAEKVLKDGVPELAEAVKQGAVAVTAAAELAELPPDDQAEVVAQGPKAARAKAAAIRRDKKAKQPQRTATEPRTGGSNTEPQTATADDQRPDKGWLKRFPIRSQLTPRNRAKFDREAMHWRRLKALNDQVLAADPGLVAEARERHDAYSAAPLLTDSFFYIRPPAQWALCDACSDNWDSSLGDGCPSCSGDGFTNVTFFDPYSSPESPLAGAEPEPTVEAQCTARRAEGASTSFKGKRAKAAKPATATPAKAKGETSESKQPKGVKAAGKPTTGKSPKPPKSRNKPDGSVVAHDPAGRAGGA